MELAEQMRSVLPADLIDFFYVNTDVGSPELGEAIAELLQHLGVVVLRCLIPRTLIDCNRVIDADPQAYRDGGVTPGLPSYITEDSDRQLLLERYKAYLDTATQLMETVCGRGGLALILHSYAPRSVGIASVGADIVQQLHWAYQPVVFEDWPLRPVVDFIVKDPTGVVVTDQHWLDALSQALCAQGLPQPASGETYPLHPVTTAHRFVMGYAPKVLCIEVRRIGWSVNLCPLCPSLRRQKRSTPLPWQLPVRRNSIGIPALRRELWGAVFGDELPGPIIHWFVGRAIMLKDFCSRIAFDLLKHSLHCSKHQPNQQALSINPPADAVA